MLHILELIAGIFGVGVGIWRLPDAASALAIVTPTAVGLVGLLAFVRHFLFHQSDAKRLGWESNRSEFQYEVGFANLAFALVAFMAYFGASGCTSCRRRSCTPGSRCTEKFACAACFRAPYPRWSSASL